MQKTNHPQGKWRRSVILFLIAFLVVATDQLSKIWIRSNLLVGQSLPKAGFFRLTHVQNTGAAFGLFYGQSLPLTIVGLVGIVILLLYVFFLRQRFPLLDNRLINSALGLVLGGTIGNLIDRLRFGYITDFIDIGIWPTFNIADSAITVPRSTRMDKTYSFVVDKAGVRLDKYVCEKCSELSRTHTQKLIDNGYITVNGQRGKTGFKLNSGDKVDITIPPSPELLSPEAIPLNIIYEDNDILVIDKPFGLTIHPAPGHPSHTLVNALLSRLPDLPDTGNSLRPGIVHRLDKDTSGVMVIAKNSTAQANLISQFKTRSVTKAYLTLVKGHLTPESGIIEAPIGRDPRNRKRMAVVAEGREARTQYRVIKYTGNYTSLEVRPETGRTHQIRVHLAAIGYPVAGDTTYGVKSAYLSRQFIHASRLGFRLPSTGEYVEFESELPPDLAQALSNIER
jgi:23S rRNA pseudouridine1911/1915/1917 synthase